MSSDVLDFANHSTKNLNILLQKAKEFTKAEKENLHLKDVRKAHLIGFNTEEKLATGVSTGVESSDYDWHF